MATTNHEPVLKRPLAIALMALVAFTALATWLCFAILRPTPPHSVAMATGPEGSFDVELGKLYREFLAREGINLRLIPTTGVVENVALLHDPKSGVGIAIIPGGITNQRDSPGLVSLGTLFYEPLWLFFSGDVPENIRNLQGLRIAIGPEGSGAHKLSLEFLARLERIDQRSADLLPLTSGESALKLQRGEIDAAVLLDAWESPAVHDLFAIKNIRLADFRRADAIIAIYPFLNKLVLPAGVADMVENRPPADVSLLAPKASLVVRSDLHPAIQYLLLEAATQIHSDAGLFHSAGQFPAPESMGLPLSTYARQFYKTGSPFLQRHLSFWLAVLAQQLLVLLIPVLGFLFPLLRLSPAIYSWAQRRRIYKLYAELKALDDGLSSEGADQDSESHVRQLDRLEDRASRLTVPISYRPLLYDLRSHVSEVRQRVRKMP